MIKLKSTDTVVFIGDSITHGGRMNMMDLNHVFGHGFQEMICARLGADNYASMPKFVNKGISGNTSAQILERYERDCLEYKPTIINLLCGVNDASQGMNPDETLANIEKMLQMAFGVDKNVKFILCEPFYLDVTNQ
ncbi:MAG: lysophospholipase, partial [Clostridia bacterium]|nr:lysophospholipase [Clostridia bacterium]